MSNHQCRCPLCITEGAIQTTRVELVGLLRGSDRWRAARIKLEVLVQTQAQLHQYIDAKQAALHEALLNGGTPSKGEDPLGRTN